MGFLIYLLIGVLVLIYEDIVSLIAYGQIISDERLLKGWFIKHPKMYNVLIDLLVILLWPIEIFGRLTRLIIRVYYKLRSK